MRTVGLSSCANTGCGRHVLPRKDECVQEAVQGVPATLQRLVLCAHCPPHALQASCCCCSTNHMAATFTLPLPPHSSTLPYTFHRHPAFHSCTCVVNPPRCVLACATPCLVPLFPPPGHPSSLTSHRRTLCLMAVWCPPSCWRFIWSYWRCVGMCRGLLMLRQIQYCPCHGRSSATHCDLHP